MLSELNRKSAPGPDGVTNKSLRNLDEPSIESLTDFINKAWNSGEVPDEWKLSQVILIPKPGKPPSLENLRPISLTSCVGKVAEHAILNRLKDYLEDNNIYTHNMLGFRSSLSTQDAMKQIKHDILDGYSRDTKAILGLDMEKAFDNIRHKYILQTIEEIGLGSKMYNYIKSFLGARTARLRVGDTNSDVVQLGDRGTPQGSVISPVLFNLCMIGLSRKLSNISNIHHTIYADDLTIWCTGGSEGQVQDALTEAVQTVEEYLRPTGLRCSPHKSELLLYRKEKGGRPKGWKPLSESDIHILTENEVNIPRVDTMRVLGFFIDANGRNHMALKKIIFKTENAYRMIRRLAGRQKGMKEDNLIRLIHSFVLCHISYAASMYNWTQTQLKKLDAAIKKVIKSALGLPLRTSTQQLLKLGVHNTTREIAEAQERSQIARLSTTCTGRSILNRIMINPVIDQETYTKVPQDFAESIIVAPLPRNMHPTFNVARRVARAKALLKKLDKGGRGACFVDSATYKDRTKFAAVVVDHQGRCTNCATVYTSKPEIAEQVAIALALTDDRYTEIYSDSKPAIRAFSRGKIAPQAVRIINSKQAIDTHYIYWFPAHLGSLDDIPMNPNESANSVARELTDRAAFTYGFDSAGFENQQRDTPTTYNEITKHYYLGRREFPPPHSRLNRAQAVTLRQLQTQSYYSPAQAKAWYDIKDMDAVCKACKKEVCTLEHMLWECGSLGPGISRERFTGMIKSHDHIPQVLAVQYAHDRAGRLDLPVPTWD